jgi:O-antigen/teichoic acid export membrane protein
MTEMRRTVLRGLGWTGATEVIMQVVRMVAAVALARLLAPDDYGLAALGLVFASFGLVFSDMALGAAIVQRKELSEDDRSTAFWLSVAGGVLFTVVGVLIAGPVAQVLRMPSAAPMCAALSASFAIVAVATIHEALLVREMEFPALQRRMVIATVAGAVVGVAIALATRNAWAIVGQQLAQTAVSSALLWRANPWRPRLRFSRVALRELAGFSGFLVGHRLLYYLHRNADNILVGRFLGASALGAYSLAYNIMLQPLARIAGPVQKVMWPAMSRMQDDPERITVAWVRVVRLLAMVTVPAMAGLVIVAPDFVHVVLGDAWAPAVPLIQVLAWVGILQALQSINTDILQALGRPNLVLRFTVLFSLAHIAGFVVGLQWGVVGVASAYAVTSTLVEPIYSWLTARALGVSVWRILGGVRGSFEAAALMAAAVWLARAALVDAGVPAFGRLVLLVLLGVITFAGASRWREPEAWRDVSGVLDGLRRRRARTVAGVPELAETRS